MVKNVILKRYPSKRSGLINFKTILLAIMLIGSNVFAQEQMVKSFSGSGSKIIRPFKVPPGWEIQWDAKEEFFQLYLYNADKTMIGVPADQMDAGKGSSYQAAGGKYSLRVSAKGNWTITIVKGSSGNVIKKPIEENKNEEYVATFSGSGGKNTRPFTVQSGWEIQWDAKGDIFQLYLYSADGTMIGVPANQQGAGKGSSYQAKGGKYYLSVNAIENWNIKIVQIFSSTNVIKKPIEENKSKEEIATFSGSGGKNTRPFTVPFGWEIQWDAKGDIFQLYLYSADGEVIGVPANQQGAGKGSSYQAKGGEYYLHVNAIGNWNIKVVKVK